MPEPQLSIRSARARTLAYDLAKKEQRSLSQVVERALEAYAEIEHAPSKQKETMAEFWERARRDFALDEEGSRLFEEALHEIRNNPDEPFQF